VTFGFVVGLGVIAFVLYQAWRERWMLVTPVEYQQLLQTGQIRALDGPRFGLSAHEASRLIAEFKSRHPQHDPLDTMTVRRCDLKQFATSSASSDSR
jgi:hypothetical protein